MYTLAAISFSDPVMLVGLLGALIPLALHLLNRIKSPIVKFSTLRFLKITAQKTSRRRQVQQYLLLLVRMAVFAMIAMAVSRPLIRGGSAWAAYGLITLLLVALIATVMALASAWAALGKAPAPAAEGAPASPQRPVSARSKKQFGVSMLVLLAALLMVGYSAFGLSSNVYFSGDKGEFSGRNTAAVIVLDNSYSMLARQDAGSRLQRAKDQVRNLLSESIKPAEAAIVATNPGENAAGETLTTDMTSLVGYLDKLQAVGRAKPMKERIRTAAEIALRSQQPGKMLIILSDYARNAFSDAEVFSAIKDIEGAKDIQVVLMPVGKGAPPADVGIATFAPAEGTGRPVVGSQITFEADVINNGDAADVKDFDFYVDDTKIDNAGPRVQLGPAGTAGARSTVRVPYRLAEAGFHRFSLRLRDAGDAMEWDDQRDCVLSVAEQAKVLVIGPEAQPRARSAAFYFMAALGPFEGTTVKDAAGKPIVWSIKPAYREAGSVQGSAILGNFAAVFVCDVPKVTPALAGSLEQYLKSGGRVVWVLGPSVDGAAYNQVLLGNGREMLPAPLDQPVVTAAGSVMDWADLQSDIFAGLFDNQEPFRSLVVSGRWTLSGNALQRGRPLAKLADSGILITQHFAAGGNGEVYTMLTTPGAAWSNLGAISLLVPMASRMTLGGSAKSRGETSYEPGDGFFVQVPGADKSLENLNLDVTTPDKSVVNIRPTVSSDMPRWYFDRTLQAGLYAWRGSDGKHAGIFVVNPPSDEVELQAADVEGLAREVGAARGAIVATSAADLLEKLDKQSEGTTLLPGVVAMVLILAVVEGMMSNRYRPAVKGVTAAETGLAQAA